VVCDVPVYFRDEEASLRAVPPAPDQVDAVLHTQKPVLNIIDISSYKKTVSPKIAYWLPSFSTTSIFAKAKNLSLRVQYIE
jgi:hypothetical protein